MNPIKQLRANLVSKFPERERVIDGALVAVLVGEHVLLIGPPGTAKSALARAIAKAFGGSYYERLLTKFSTPEELFGPISLKALEQDRFERVIADKLPTVEFGFCDEIFKANSAILNSLLTLMNERLFHNGGPPVKCPLITLFGASNELPEDKNLDALTDRFLLKYEVQYVKNHDSFESIITNRVLRADVLISMSDLHQMQRDVARVKVSKDTVKGITSIRDACVDNQITVSDRRWVACVKLAQARAFLDGRDETAPEDLAILADVLWREPQEQTKVADIVAKYGDPIYSMVNEVVRSAKEAGSRRASGELQDQLNYLRTIVGRTVNERVAVKNAINAVEAIIAEVNRPLPQATLGRGVIGTQRNS